MPQMHSRQPGFTYSVCGPSMKNKEKIKKFKEICDIFIQNIFIKMN